MVYRIDNTKINTEGFSPSEVLAIVDECTCTDLEIYNYVLSLDLQHSLNESVDIVNEAKSTTEFIKRKAKEVIDKAVKILKETFYRFIAKVKELWNQDKKLYKDHIEDFKKYSDGINFEDIESLKSFKDYGVIANSNPLDNFNSFIKDRLKGQAELGNIVKSLDKNNDFKEEVELYVKQIKEDLSSNGKNMDEEIKELFFDSKRDKINSDDIKRIANVLQNQQKFIKDISNAEKEGEKNLRETQNHISFNNNISSLLGDEKKIAILNQGAYDVISAEITLLSKSYNIMMKYALKYIDECRAIFKYCISKKAIKNTKKNESENKSNQKDKSKMKEYEGIERRIATNDIKGLRRAIGNIAYLDRDFSSGEFDRVIRHVEEKGIKLKDEHLIGDPIISSTKSAYTDDDFSRAVFELKENFCDERIEDVKKIGKALYGKK